MGTKYESRIYPYSYKSMVLRRKSEDTRELIPMTDLHFGSLTHRADLAEQAKEYILKNDAWVFDLGDTIELATRNSIGAGVYEQTMNPDQQIDYAIEWYKPIAERGLLLGILDSNHHARSMRESGINATKQIARGLGVPYLGYSAFLWLRVGSQTYSIWGHHGVSGSTTPHGKMAAVRKLGADVDCDVCVSGHTHVIHHHEELRRRVNPTTKGYEKYKKHYVIGGSYVDYEQGYPQQANYTPEVLGTPSLILHGDKKRVEFKRNIVNDD